MHLFYKQTYHLISYIVIFGFVISCSSDESELIPSEEELVSTILNKACLEWGTSQEIVMSQMNGFTLIDSDDDFIQYSDKSHNITVSYDFDENKLRATVAIIPKTGNDLSRYLTGYTELGALSNKVVSYSNQKNTMCFSYETTNNDTEYSIIGFSPLVSDLYDMLEPIDITTNEVVDIKLTSCVVKGTITGVTTSISCGVRYSTNPNSLTSVAYATKSSGDFEVKLTGLARNTKYYCMCYAIYDGYTYYGNMESFTTLQSLY